MLSYGESRAFQERFLQVIGNYWNSSFILLACSDKAYEGICFIPEIEGAS